MRIRILNLIKLSLLLTISCGSPLLANEQQNERLPGNNNKHLRDAAKYRLEFQNDAVFGSDNQFSSGWAFQLHSPVANSWHSIEGPAKFLKQIGAWVPTLTAADLKYRMSISIGQIIQTPDDIENTDLITDDVPFAGILTTKSSWIAFNDNEFRGFEIVLGVMGRPSLGEQSQNFVHNIIDADIAEGWDNQLKTEPVLNVNYMRKKKFYRAGNPGGFSFDAAINVDAQLGTMFSAAGARLEARFGSNMPRGFAFQADPIGRFLTYDATMAPPNPDKPSIYASVTVGSSYFAHNILLDGNVFRDTVHSVDKENVVSRTTIGMNYETRKWGVHVDFYLTTDSVDTDKVTSNPDTENQFGTIVFEWRI